MGWCSSVSLAFTVFFLLTANAVTVRQEGEPSDISGSLVISVTLQILCERDKACFEFLSFLRKLQTKIAITALLQNQPLEEA